MRPAAAGVVLGLALAVGVPTAWELTRPAAAAGASVVDVLGTPAAPTPRATPAPDRLPEATARPAGPADTQRPAAPVRITAPGLGIDARVDAVGVDPNGLMTLPEDVDRVGWYRFGPVPGQEGSSVLAGHVDDEEQGLGALSPLRRAEVGDELAVTDADGTTSRWRVVARELIRKRALPVGELFRRDGAPRLTLITCGGPFLPEFGSYRDNVVVVAEPVGGGA
jgi:hypothetical protein